ncbi:MAG: twin-arginine translocase subunit TatB [Candidatus Contendobacter sp.]|nr:MAG: twin-arginine translocase subunit TatB [Candidatus Contendobacter sp.]
MFEIGFWELVVVGVVAMIVVGPEQLPGLARKAGFWLGKAKRMIAEVKAEVDRELHLEEIKQSLRQQADLGEVKDLTDQMKSFRREIEEEFDDPGPPPGWQPGMPTAAPPPGWTPPVSSSTKPPATVAAPAPVRLQKPDSTASVQTLPPTPAISAEIAATPPPSPSPPAAN